MCPVWQTTEHRVCAPRNSECGMLLICINIFKLSQTFKSIYIHIYKCIYIHKLYIYMYIYRARVHSSHESYT